MRINWLKARKIIETGKRKGLITDGVPEGIKKMKQPGPPHPALQIKCRVCGAPKDALCKPVNGWIAKGAVHWTRAADFEIQTASKAF